MCVHGGSVGGADVYVMVNAYWEPITFHVQEGPPEGWRRIVDTGRESPDDFVEPGAATALASADYVVGPRSIVVLVR
jgi:glycogen operon protein